MQQFSLPFSSIEAKNIKIDSNICEIESHNKNQDNDLTQTLSSI